MRAGFSLSDIERLYAAEDVRTLGSVLEEARKQNRIERLLTKLDIAEAVNHAIVGSQPDRQKRNQTGFQRWIQGIERTIAKLQDQHVETVWDRLPRRSRKIGK